jgi:alpha-tubulin suppressor-like RCC1 family protein
MAAFDNHRSDHVTPFIRSAVVAAILVLLGSAPPAAARQSPEGIVVQSVAAGGMHTCALDMAGNAFCWGENDAGQLGDGTEPSLDDAFASGAPVPVAVMMPAGVRFVSIHAGMMHTVALTATGSVYAWGSNDLGQLGDGTLGEPVDYDDPPGLVPVAVRMPPGVRVASLSAGGMHTVALTTDGVAYAWGANFAGQLGDGTTTSRATPVTVVTPPGVSFATVVAGAGHTVGLTASGTAYAWGLDGSGQLGGGALATATCKDGSDEMPCALRPVPVRMPDGVTFTYVAAGMFHTLALTADGAAYGWGMNQAGQLGGGSGGAARCQSEEEHVACELAPVAIDMPEGVRFTAIDAGERHSVALTADGTAYACALSSQAGGQFADVRYWRDSS